MGSGARVGIKWDGNMPQGHGDTGHAEKNAILMLVLLFYVVARVAGKNEDARDVVHSRNKKRTRSYGLTE